MNYFKNKPYWFLAVMLTYFGVNLFFTIYYFIYRSMFVVDPSDVLSAFQFWLLLTTTFFIKTIVSWVMLVKNDNVITILILSSILLLSYWLVFPLDFYSMSTKLIIIDFIVLIISIYKYLVNFSKNNAS